MTKIERPSVLNSVTYQLNTELGNLHLTVSLDSNDQPYEILGHLGKNGSFQCGVTELVCRLISLHLQQDTLLEDIIKQCEGIQDMQPFYNQLESGQYVKVIGLGDSIASVLKLFLEVDA